MEFLELRQRYIEELQRYSNCFEKNQEEIADRMLKAIFNSNYPSDWLKHNKALKNACKGFGMFKSGELREFVKESMPVEMR